MTDALDQTEHAAAELLAHGFGQKLQPGGSGTPSAGLPAGSSVPLSPSSAAATTHHSLPAVRTTISPQGTSLRPSGGSLPSQTHNNGSMISSPRSRQPNSLRPRGNRGVMSPTAASAGGTGTSTSGLHPVIRLGYQPVCSVVCNGLRGEFLGGHDRDMLIKVTSGHYAGLPLIDVSLGGCIMTCSQFERYAGRELSKKWKESIHVVGEGEGSRATLLSWLKRKAEQDFGASVVGKKVWVCWCADAEYYQGTIVSYNKEGGKHTVQYSSRLSEDLHLAVEKISFDIERPTVPTASDAEAVAAMAAAAAAAGGVVLDGSAQHYQMPQVPAVSAPAGVERAGNSEAGVAFFIPSTAAATTATANGNINNLNTNGGAMAVVQSPLWHQGSGISVTSSYGDELRGNAALIAMATGARNGVGGNGGGGGVLRAAAGQRAGGGLGRARISSDGYEGIGTSPRSRRKPVNRREDDFAMPAPKRALSAPAAVLLAEAAAAAAAIAAEEQLASKQQPENNTISAHPVSVPLVDNLNQANAYLPSSLPTLSLPLPSLLLPLPPPPLGALAASADPTTTTGTGSLPPEALSAAVNWMHDVVLCLDNEMEDTERRQKITATTGTPAATTSEIISPANSAPFISPSGRFQALLGLLRGTPACLYGIFESMVRRYNHFAGIPQLQRQKLVELMLATLIEAAAPRDLFKSVEAEAVDKAAAKDVENVESGGAGRTKELTTSPSPSLLNNAKNNNVNRNDHQGHLKMLVVEDDEADGTATAAR